MRFEKFYKQTVKLNPYCNNTPIKIILLSVSNII